jgi:hypothetical protein
MIINPEELRYCFDKTEEIEQQYKLYNIASDDPRRSVDNLRTTCECYLETQINFHRLAISSKANPLWGACIEKSGEFDICYLEDLNHCWERFVICKEIFHVILKKDEYRNPSIRDHIEELAVIFPDGHQPGLPAVAEKLAEVAAIEFLLPYKSRAEIIVNGNGKINYRDVAERYKVPLVFVERYLSSRLMNFLKPYCKDS